MAGSGSKGAGALVILRPTALVLGGVLLSILLLTGTDAGLKAVAPFMARAMGSVIGGQVALEGLNGSLWDRFGAGRVEMAFDDGSKVAISGLDIQWSPSKLLAGRVSFESLHATTVEIALPPTDVQTAPAYTVPSLPLGVRIGDLDVPSITVSGPEGGAIYALSLKGAARGEPDGSFDTSFALKSADRVGEAITFSAGYSPDDRQLSLDIKADLPSDAALWRILGFDAGDSPSLSLALYGKGASDSWHGNLKADGGAYGGAQAALTVGFVPGFIGSTLTLNGTVSPGSKLLADNYRFLAGTYYLGADLKLQSGESLEVSRLALAREDLGQAEGSGVVSMKGDYVFNGSAGLTDAFAPFLDDGLHWKLMQAVINAGSKEGFHADVKVDGFRSDYPVLDALAGGEPTAMLSGQFVGGMVKFDRMTVKGIGMDAEATGTLDDAGTLVLKDVVAKVPSIGIVPGLKDMAGRLAATSGQLTVRNDGSVHGDISARLTEFRSGLAALDRAAGNTPEAEFTLDVDADGAVALGDVKAKGLDGSSIEGVLHLPAAMDGLSAAFKGSIPAEVAKDLSAGALVASGNIGLNGEVSGPFDGLVGSVDAQADGVTLAGRFPMKAVKARAKLTRKNGQAVIGANLEGDVAGKALRARASIAPDGEELRISDASVDSAWLEATGDFALARYDLPLAGRIRVARLDLSSLPESISVAGTGGTLQGDFTFRAEAGRQLLATDNLTVDAPRMGNVRVESLHAKGVLRDLFGIPSFKVEAKFSGVSGVGKVKADVGGEAEGTFTDFRYTLDAKTTSGPDGEMTAKGTVANENGRAGIVVSQMDGRFKGSPFRLPEPAHANLSGGRLAGADFKMAALGGSVSANYRHEAGEYGFDARVEGVQLPGLADLAGLPAMDGQLSGALSLRQPEGGETEGNFTLEGGGLRLSAEQQDMPKGRLSVTGNVSRGKVSGEGNLDFAGRGKLAWRLGIPVRVSLADMDATVGKGGRLSGHMEGNGDIAAFWPASLFPDHELQGMLQASLDLAGTVSSPSMSGEYSLKDGRYENLEYGIIATALNAEGSFTDNRIILRSLNAGDGESGALAGKGWVDLNNLVRPRYEFALEGNDFHLVRRDEVSLYSDIALSIADDGANASIKGRMDVKKGEVDLAAAMPPAVPTLDVTVQEDGTGSPQGKSAQPAGGNGGPTLDLHVNAPGRVFVRGRGLDSEWSADLGIGGTTGQPIVSGKMQSVRGQLDVVGKTFALQTSKVTFTGGKTVDPLLDIASSYKTSDLSVTARLEGRMSSPELTLTSDPSYPKDEILSRIFFNKSRGGLSPVEAAQLANAAAQLSGQTSGFDVLSSIRRFVGVDVLQVDTGEKGASVKAGKYIEEGVYVGAKQGASPGSGGVEVEVEVTPNISVRTETGQTGDSNTSIQFRWDY